MGRTLPARAVRVERRRVNVPLMRPAPSLLVLALAVIAGSRCDCTTEVPLPPPPIGDGDPIGPPDAGDVDERDAGPLVCDDDDNEDNDERADAVPLENDAPVEGTACGDDDDWYSIASAPGCSVLAEMTQGADAVGDVDMLVFDPDGQLVGSSATAGNVEAVNVPAAKNGAYAVRLRSGSRDTVPYSLRVVSTCAADLTCPTDDRLEDNDTPDVPALLNEGVAHDGILCGVDQDWFFVPVTIGCIADARAEFVHAEGDIDLELYRADGVTRVGNSAGTSDSERLTKVVTEGGMRYRLFFFAAAEANDYRFIVQQTCAGQLACPSDDPFEPNDTRGQARRLFGGIDEVIGTVCGNDDFFDVIPQQGCTLHATLEFVNLQGDLDLELVTASDGARIAISQSTDDDEELDFAAADAARVVYRVFGFNGASNSYRLHIDTSCP